MRTFNGIVQHKLLEKHVGHIREEPSHLPQEKERKRYGFLWRYDTTYDHVIEGEVWQDLDPDIVGGVVGYLHLGESEIDQVGYKCLTRRRVVTRVSTLATRLYPMHRLVALTFLPNPLGLKVVNHKNGTKDDPRAVNLEWMSHSENTRHAFASGLNTGAHVLQYTADGRLYASYPSIALAARKSGVGDCSIQAACCGRQHTGGGYIWRYA